MKAEAARTEDNRWNASFAEYGGVGPKGHSAALRIATNAAKRFFQKLRKLVLSRNLVGRSSEQESGSAIKLSIVFLQRLQNIFDFNQGCGRRLPTNRAPFHLHLTAI